MGRLTQILCLVLENFVLDRLAQNCLYVGSQRPKTPRSPRDFDHSDYGCWKFGFCFLLPRGPSLEETMILANISAVGIGGLLLESSIVGDVCEGATIGDGNDRWSSHKHTLLTNDAVDVPQ